ncbi:selina-4(15),7(11)-diene synthase [Streptomyces sp. SL13]|uniref:Terpene synthase n=1 Tax=Streptantibioticus silvisoli TaxID=2705255 RepID=A0AA90HAA1_9ACTN|nr:selina-4(15),7(11)-diene synthase [Streptantibioticus silvisoli]MDI5961153.1 selina-4(15),7(11)-diene synthase [Streptantibioticus silvisoli]MDI5970957.1 selina-4(15),7(11)-diene synthase [Streptantibioticus silvisoli]
MTRGLISVPPIYSPFWPAIHPHHERVERRTAAWAETYIVSEGLRANLVAQGIGGFAARILPEGDEAVVDILADFVIWLFGVDDGYCEDGALGTRPGELATTLSRLLRVAQNPQAPLLEGDQLANGLRDLRQRISARGATPAQVARWVDALREYFLSVVCEAHYRSQGLIPDLDDYTLMRIYDGATTVVLPLLELGGGYELSPDERDRDEVRAVAEMASMIICWDNDIFSYHKESGSSGYYLNVLRVLTHHYGLTLDEALAQAIAQRDRVTTLFVDLCAELYRSASPQLERYLDSLAHFVRGSQDWGISSRRYLTPGADPADLPTHFRSNPTDSSSRPLGIAPIAWWWDLVRSDGRPSTLPTSRNPGPLTRTA